MDGRTKLRILNQKIRTYTLQLNVVHRIADKLDARIVSLEREASRLEDSILAKKAARGTKHTSAL